MTIQDIMNFTPEEINAMSRKELAKVTSQLASAGNKRLARFEAKGISTPAVRGIENSGGRFSIAGKNLNDVRHEFARARDFLQAETSTQEKWSNVKEDTSETLRNKYGIDMKPEQFDTFWRAYEKAKEKDPNIIEKAQKYKVLDDIAELVQEGKSVDEIVNALDTSAIYEEEEEKQNGTSVHFTNVT